MSRAKLQEIIDQFDAHKIGIFFRTRSDAFAEAREPIQEYNDAVFSDFERLGEFRFDETQRLIVVAVRVGGNLTERSSKKAQYDKAKRILKDLDVFTGGIFVFYDKAGSFRFSLVYERSTGTRRTWNNFRRFTYFVSKELPNKTFINRIGNGDFTSLPKLKEAFSIAAVTNDFYQSFVPYFEKISKAALSTTDEKIRKKLARDFALLFVIRVIFIGFIQKRKWIGNDEQFLRHYWEEYRQQSMGENHFYKHWLEPLFFEALNSPIGRKVKYGNNTFSTATESALQMAPYLNGGLFKRKRGVDDQSLFIPDDVIGELFDWLFSYNFTIEENTLYDEELELNPEFLGIIFERLVNKADGAVYTPRVEVDFMCRLSLVKWLDKNTSEDIHYRDLYELFFSEVGRGRGEDTDQKKGSFSERQAREILERLESVTICDPAVGSGAFPVGMLHIIDEVEEHLRLKISDPVAHQTAFDRKKRIIGSSLYGVEVKEWAVWITQLRLWITLFIDAPDDLRNSLEPILPSLDFKVRAGDSLMQRIGTKIFPVAGHANVSQGLKKKITELKKLKLDYFQNKADRDFIIRQRELALYRDILNAEIDDLTKTLRILKGIKPDQQSSLFSKEIQHPTQAQLSLSADEVNKIESQIAELQGQQRSLSDDHPLIWNIEFAEIFADRDGFDIIIGNPPYVRQEDIADPNGKIKDPKEYKKLLQEMVRTDFPRQFPKGEKIDAKSDLYTYFYIRSLKLLNPNGVLTFICSNSWLDVGYGVWLQKFLLKNAPVQFIIDNHAKRSFEAADINTIIAVIDAPAKKVASDHLVKFVAFKKPFEEVLFTENLLTIEETTVIQANESERVYPITTEQLLESGMEYQIEQQKQLSGGKYIGDKWGNKYLRAPDIFFAVLKRGEKNTEKLSQYLEGERYLNTGGADGFFIVNEVEFVNEKFAHVINRKTTDKKPNLIFEGDIERKYLVPLIKDSAKKEKTIEINAADAFCVVIQNLTEGDKIHQYIKWGEIQEYNQRSVTRNSRPWYKPTRQMLSGAEILLPRSFNNVFAIHYNPQRLLSLRFYRLHVKQGDMEAIVAYLNSTFFWLIFETLGNKSLGQGVLDFFMEDVLNLRIPIVLTDDQRPMLRAMQKRQIKNIFEECGIDSESNTAISKQVPKPLPDRAALDKVIFDVLGLTEEERMDVYRAVCQLVWNRISKAQSV